MPAGPYHGGTRTMDWLAALAHIPKTDALLSVLALAAVGWSAVVFAQYCRQYRRWIAWIEGDGLDEAARSGPNRTSPTRRRSPRCGGSGPG